MRSALGFFQGVILSAALVAPAAVLADDPPVTDPPSPPPATEPLPPPPDTDPAPPVEPAVESPAMCVATGRETIATDKFDYAPEETVSVTGTGYAASCEVVVRVTRPDGSIVVGDGSFAAGSDTIATTAAGNLAYDYMLDGIEGEYLIEVMGDGGTVLASALFSDSVPSGAGNLYADAAGTIPKQAFQVGDTIYARFSPVTTPDDTARYKFVLLQPNGTEFAPSMTACLAPDATGTVVGVQVVSQTAFSTVGGRWRERLYVYANTGCTGATSIRPGQTFHVFQSFAYDSLATRDACNSDATCAATTPAFAPGDDVYLRIAVSEANRGPSGMRFIKPDGVTVACTVGFLGSDANGAMSFTYPSGTCPAIGSTAADIGPWTMDVSAVLGGSAASTTFLPQFTTNIPAFVVKAPLTVTTAVHDPAHVDVTGGSVALGTTVHDTASLTGTVTGLATAPVVFTLYDDATCTGNATTVAVNGAEDAAIASDGVASLGAGDYSFKASVAEDASYFGDESPCEPFTVLTGTATVVTELHREVAGNDHLVLGTVAGVPYGATTHDTAIVTGVTGVAPTGTVQYDLFSSNGVTGCTGTPIDTETVAVGVESSSKSNLAPGRYSYLATYSGDSNYPGAVPAACEILEVGRATPGVATQVHADGDHVTDIQGTSVPLGTSAHDKTIITPVDGLAVTGTITYTFFDGTTNEFAALCDGPRTSETVAVGTESSVKGPLAAGSYGFRATYNGNANYLPTTGPCETFTVAKATPTITTQVHRDPHVIVPSPSAVPLGSLVHDSSIFGGQVGSFVIDGNVTYTVYRTAFGEPAQNCSGPIFKDAEVVAVGSETTPIGPLATGRYTIKAVYGGNANYTTATAACEVFEVAKATPRVETVVRLETEAGSTPVSNPGVVALGSTVHDRAFVVGKVDGFDFTGTVTFTLFKGAQNCAGTVVDGPEEVALGSPTESSSFGPLTAGRYSYLATYNGNDNYTSASGPCEIFEVPKGATSTTTELHEGSRDNAATHIVIPVGGFTFAPNLHDQATVTGDVSGVPMTGQVQYIFFDKNLNPYASVCDGQPRLTETKNLGEESSDKTNLPPGQYAFRARYLGDANYLPSWSSCEPFTVVPNNAVTSSSLCTFDFDSTLAGSQFRLIYTPDMANPVYKLNASNPGQFFYNVFYTGAGGEEVTLNIPAPFQTQGANPVHVYAGVTPVTIDGVTCYTPGTELLGATIEGAPITGTTGGTIKVTLPTLSSGFAYIAVHLDYGQKKVVTGCTKGASGEAICTIPPTTTINQNQAYTFGFTNGSSGSATVHSINEFKKNPGVGGSLLKVGSDEPVATASVEIWQGTKKMATVKTDNDGWFMWSYKYTGKPATFTVKAPAYGLTQSASLKSNGFLVFNLTAP
jgi:hypothetical protein